MVCEMCEEGPCIQPHIEFTCYETLSQGMQQILDYFFPDYNSQKPWGTSFYFVPPKTSPSPFGMKTYPPFVTGTQKPYTGTYKPSGKLFFMSLSTPVLKGPINKSRAQSSGILHIEEDP